MGLFEMFKKEAACDRCAMSIDKGQLCSCEFEAPLAEQEKGQLLCRSCLEASFREYMESYNGRIVAVWPMKKYDGYHLYRFDDMPNMEYSSAFIAAIRRKLPSGQSCGGCNHEAKVAWFSPDLVKGSPVDFAARSDGHPGHHHHGMGHPVEIDFPVDEACNGEYLCAACFTKAVFQKINEVGSLIGQTVICSQGDAFFTPMEAS
ncbi:MAG: hypothetical protein HQL22_03445 [Candidatus Omnitrophica bacterium]|nr:hypothetical protein [Candidatus Omnitrophota bacterium]